MPLVVGVTFRKVGKVYYFDPGELPLQEGDFVIAETARGMEFGEVVIQPREVPDEELAAPLKRVVRVATGDDLQREASNREREKHAFEVCERKIAEHELPMKLLEAEYAFDGSQVTFSFSADGRIDFRELVKDVAGALKVKVQLHQIGVRDEAKLVGGYGGCGRSLCCATFLSNFEPISMKMAKDQSLFLNPAKFSGVCGKLMCCLRYEHEHYKLSQKQLPAVGAILQLDSGKAKVLDVNVISKMITVETEGESQLHIHADQIKLEGLCRRHGIGCNMTEKNCQRLVAEELTEAIPDADEDTDEEIVEEILSEDPEVVSLLDEIVMPPNTGGVTFRTPRSAPDEKHDNNPASSNNENGKAPVGPDRRRRNRSSRGNGRPNRASRHENNATAKGSDDSEGGS